MDSFCNICPNKCNKERNPSSLGICGETNEMKIAKYYLHPFEEPVISGTKGSGTVFFTGCSLKCVFCQNYELSRSMRGKTVTPKELADIFHQLEDMGAHNINLVTPTHFVNGIMEAISIYKPKIPVLYNTHSYENIETLRELNKYIDIYLPDFKFMNPMIAERYTGKKSYPEIAMNAIKFMMESKETIIEDGLMKQGVIIRHLILPLSQNDSIKIINWYNDNKVNGAYISIMSQYTPFGNIDKYPELKRPITAKEYNRVVDEIMDLKIENCFIQDRTSSSTKFIPSWDY